MTDPERLLWEQLRGHRLGVRWRRQHPMWGYIADFWCPQALLVVELDGAGHDPVADQRRDRIRASHGIRTIRFANADVWDRLDCVVVSIREVMADRGVALE